MINSFLHTTNQQQESLKTHRQNYGNPTEMKSFEDSSAEEVSEYVFITKMVNYQNQNEIKNQSAEVEIPAN